MKSMVVDNLGSFTSINIPKAWATTLEALYSEAPAATC
jgi:hypothetical protein